MRPVLLLLPLLGACAENEPIFRGLVTSDLFPFDGDRTWIYLSTDETLSYRLVATILGSESIDGRNVYTVQYVKDCVANDPECIDGDVVRTIRWSSTSTDGVHVYGWSEGSTLVDLDPPVQVATDTMAADDFVVTTTGGADWTSTLVGTEACPIAFTANWDQCVAFQVETTGAAGAPLVGTWWAAATHNVVAFEIAGDTGRWELWDFDCEGDCDGVW